MSFLRFAASTPFAMLVTVLVFLMMLGLIKQDDPLPPPPPPTNPITLPKVSEDPPRNPPKPDPIIDEKPPIIDTKPVFPDGGDGPVIITDPPPPPPGPGPDRIVPPSGVVPMVVMPPIYPQNCAQRGVEGRVYVIFDITNGGEVVNARVQSSDDSCLDKAALKAISGWKYQPALNKDPAGIRVQNQVQVIIFQLDQ